MVSFGRSGGDEKVVHVFEYICSINAKFIVYWLEQMIDHCLKCHWGICKSEVHDIRFKEAVFRFERCLMLVSFFDTDIVVSPSDIELGEDPGIFYLGD